MPIILINQARVFLEALAMNFERDNRYFREGTECMRRRGGGGVVKIVLSYSASFLLSSGHRNRGAPKKRFKNNLKKSLGAYLIDHHRWSTLAANRELGITPSIKLSPPSKPRAGPDSRTAGKGRNTAKPLHYPRIRPSSAAAAAGPACPALIISAMSVPVVHVDQPPLRSSFAKQSHDDDVFPL